MKKELLQFTSHLEQGCFAGDNYTGCNEKHLAHLIFNNFLSGTGMLMSVQISGYRPIIIAWLGFNIQNFIFISEED